MMSCHKLLEEKTMTVSFFNPVLLQGHPPKIDDDKILIVFIVSLPLNAETLCKRGPALSKCCICLLEHYVNPLLEFKRAELPKNSHGCSLCVHGPYANQDGGYCTFSQQEKLHTRSAYYATRGFILHTKDSITSHRAKSSTWWNHYSRSPTNSRLGSISLLTPS